MLITGYTPFPPRAYGGFYNNKNHKQKLGVHVHDTKNHYMYRVHFLVYAILCGVHAGAYM